MSGFEAGVVVEVSDKERTAFKGWIGDNARTGAQCSGQSYQHPLFSNRCANQLGRVAISKNSALSASGGSEPYAPGSTLLIESTTRSWAAHSRRSSRGV